MFHYCFHIRVCFEKIICSFYKIEQDSVIYVNSNRKYYATFNGLLLFNVLLCTSLRCRFTLIVICNLVDYQRIKPEQLPYGLKRIASKDQKNAFYQFCGYCSVKIFFLQGLFYHYTITHKLNSVTSVENSCHFLFFSFFVSNLLTMMYFSRLSL